MRIFRGLPLLLALALTAAIAAPVAAAPANKNAVVLTLECESGDVLVTTIAQNAASAAQVVGGGTAVIVRADASSLEDPDTVLFSFGNRGFDNAGLDTETCTLVDNPAAPGLVFVFEIFFPGKARAA